ncbi:hypothetical protein HYC85_030411 [Camellia sinensis]|uniref:Uncharacterized protein n=1 Tax=Camellia sinensis TaxID=4442 RepID=A0A7J7G0N1_CAMSI|nr:hypothetical protein HYC85_030411 [Camellia sinensis]
MKHSARPSLSQPKHNKSQPNRAPQFQVQTELLTTSVNHSLVPTEHACRARSRPSMQTSCL